MKELRRRKNVTDKTASVTDEQLVTTLPQLLSISDPITSFFITAPLIHDTAVRCPMCLSYYLRFVEQVFVLTCLCIFRDILYIHVAMNCQGEDRGR